MAEIKVVLDEAAIHALGNRADVHLEVAARGEAVAARANQLAEQLFSDLGGGGVGSVESHVDVGPEGNAEARIGYPPEHFYMNFHEFGTVHEPPRPHLRPALYGSSMASVGALPAGKGKRSAPPATRSKRSSRG